MVAPSEALRFPESEALGGHEITRIPDQVATFFMLVDMTIQRMDNVGIVVDDLDAAVAFFTELGMELEGPDPTTKLLHL